MNRTLSIQTLSLIAIGLAVASAVFCWRWAVRYKATIRGYATEIESLKAKQDDFEFNVVNLAALLMRSREETSGGGRLFPVGARVTPEYAARLTSPRVEAIEAARADSFLYWYYDQICEYLLDKATTESAGLVQTKQSL